MAHGHGAWLKPHLIMRHTNPQSHCSEKQVFVEKAKSRGQMLELAEF